MLESDKGTLTTPPRMGGGLERWAERHLRILMLAPTVLILLALTIFPSLYMFYAAVHKISPNPDLPWQFVGPGNFARLLSDTQFHVALRNTAVFTIAAVTIEFLLGLGLALLLDRFIRRLTFLKTVLMIPMMLPPIAVAITWKIIYEPQFGVLNEIMFRLGLPLQAWAGDVNLAMFSIIVADVWQWTPFIFLLMLAGLASLPVEPYEAAVLDGASSWRQFWDLTLPFLKPVIAIALLLRVMDALRLFDLVFILTGGGPADRTKVLSLYIYQVAYRFADTGYAAAISLFVLFVTIVLSTWFMKRMRLAE
ncbi:sugar ABC transporter permease [Sinorhizobium fredii USDA 205]|uniref:ABC transporter permease subunit n=3 Tax=Rhizobium fredii TaxID=380 RepID=A0A844A8B4_RHIFR|nr:sugar ABC transporter permease [Sinorhizobium fredii]KSV85836.1 sugar ABC transporter permease [Sinorhizobium fredii USDA 205]MQX09424.1 ABC transporter permease subunit [Sinorhizobium fredii]UTY45754.1 sugar ABC transporter permease [Sinorhizobium fredii]GEC31285.1 sugar ABC transporter permease [Sinorhizobium fredii]GLS07510.1 sugar ABC transporter permease [Sinorhizobium fredii]